MAAGIMSVDDRNWYDVFNKLYSSRRLSLETPIYPLYVGLKITENCNQNCKHCWSARRMSAQRSLRSVLNGIEKIGKINPLHFTLTGGEPLIRKDCLKILEYSKERFPIIELFTNGVLIDKNISKSISLLFDDYDFVQISLDGLREDYSRQRGSDDFLKVIRNIDRLLSYDINVRINMTVTPLNITSMVDVCNLAIRMGVNTVSFTPVYPLNRGKGLISGIDYAKYWENCESISSLNSQKTRVNIIYPIEILSEKFSRLNDIDNDKTKFVFNTDILHWAIDGKGDIFHFMDHSIVDELKIGNIYTDSINQILANLKKIQKKILFHSLEKLKCARCCLKNSCQGFYYVNSYPALATGFRRCRFNEKIIL